MIIDVRLIDATTGEVIYSMKGKGKASQTAVAAILAGMRPGLELEVFEAGEPLVDPATGKSLGAPEVLVGTVVVDRVLEQFSTAKVPEGATIARGHVVRLKPTKP